MRRSRSLALRPLARRRADGTGGMVLREAQRVRCTQDLTHGPRLARTTARAAWRRCIGNFAKVSEAAIRRVLQHGCEKKSMGTATGSIGIAANADPRVNEGAEQPGPHRALVIDGIARTRPAFVPRRVAGL